MSQEGAEVEGWAVGHLHNFHPGYWECASPVIADTHQACENNHLLWCEQLLSCTDVWHSGINAILIQIHGFEVCSGPVRQAQIHRFLAKLAVLPTSLVKKVNNWEEFDKWINQISFMYVLYLMMWGVNDLCFFLNNQNIWSPYDFISLNIACVSFMTSLSCFQWMLQMCKCDRNEMNQVKPDMSQSHQILERNFPMITWVT